MRLEMSYYLPADAKLVRSTRRSTIASVNPIRVSALFSLSTARVICVLCLVTLLNGEAISFVAAQQGQQLTAQQAIAEAQRKAIKPGSSFSVLREIQANDDTRRVGEQALKNAKTHKVDLYANGLLIEFLLSGGYMLAEADPLTGNLIAMHLVSLGFDGAPKDFPAECHGVVKLADAQAVLRDTAELVGQFYSIPASEDSSLVSKYFGGTFPECDPIGRCTLFAIPRSFLKFGADLSECKEIAALYGSFALLPIRYEVSMSNFSADPVAAIQATAEKMVALQKNFLQANHMDPHLDLDPAKIQGKEQLRERIDLLRRLIKYMEEGLKNEVDPALVRANISVAAISLGVDQESLFAEEDKTQLVSVTASLLMIYWQRLPAGGIALKYISEADL
jgi:hypothetical protein